MERFTPFFCSSPSFFSPILRKKSCLLAALIFLDNSRKWQPAVRKRNMTSKYGLPIVAVRWTDCDSGTPIFWSVSFLVGRGGGGGDLLQEAGACPVISSCPPPSGDGRPKWDRVFPNVTVLENGERVTVKVERRRKWQRTPSWQNTGELKPLPPLSRVGCGSLSLSFFSPHHRWKPPASCCFFFFLSLQEKEK